MIPEKVLSSPEHQYSETSEDQTAITGGIQ
jgi:hypothetical protein